MHQPATPDPLASLPVPSASGPCLNGNFSSWAGGVTVIPPGNYCTGLTIANGRNVRFDPGTYFINGDFSVQGGARILDSDDVTFLITNGRVNFANGANLRMTAPTTGTWAGVLIYQRSSSPGAAPCTHGAARNHFAGGIHYTFGGALYFPNCGLLLDNNAWLRSPGNSFTMVAAHSIEAQGSARIEIDLKNVYGLPASVAGGSGGTRIRLRAPLQTAEL